jgi:chromosome partitioning related protein ParA
LIDADVPSFPSSPLRPALSGPHRSVGGGETTAVSRHDNRTSTLLFPTTPKAVSALAAERIDRGFRFVWPQPLTFVDAYDCADRHAGRWPCKTPRAGGRHPGISDHSRILSAREPGRNDGTLTDWAKRRSGAAQPHESGDLSAGWTTDGPHRAGIREDFIKLKGRVGARTGFLTPRHTRKCDTSNPRASPRESAGHYPSAYTVMHALAWELIPSLEGVFARNRVAVARP